MITSKEPENWQDLQNEVAKILSECGFSVEVEKVIKTARGKVEIDVYAEEIIKGRKYIIACECKYWRNKVPQSVIHSFRTVLADIGVNVGYIVSMVGFQSGAFKASELTNVELVTWRQFQEAFEDTWYEVYLINEVVKRLDPLLTYTEPLLPGWFDKLTEEDKNKYIALKGKYDIFGWLIMQFTPYLNMFKKEKRLLPISATEFRDKVPEHEFIEKIPENIASTTGYREFLELISEYGGHAIAQFRVFRDKYT